MQDSWGLHGSMRHLSRFVPSGKCTKRTRKREDEYARQHVYLQY
jgi:hypothetical protein